MPCAPGPPPTAEHVPVERRMLGLLQRAPLGDGPVRYELVRPDADHHHHLVCDRCDYAVEAHH